MPYGRGTNLDLSCTAPRFGIFTNSDGSAMPLSVGGGWLWDLIGMPVASFAPVALCAIVIVVLASAVKNARQ
jgi:hypothetical protein